jgi:hypothetical protein
MSNTTWFIGDVHGCLEPLQRLEELIGETAAREGSTPFIVSLGDLVDRGPDSAGVVAHFRRGAAEGTHAAILGNHEEMLLRTLIEHAPGLFDGIDFSPNVSHGDLYRLGRPAAAVLSRADFETLSRLMWLSQGGALALASWGVDSREPPSRWALPADDLAYLCSLPVLFENAHAVATHALVTTADLDELRRDNPLDTTRRDVIQRALWVRRLPDTPPDPRVHVSGHTPLRRVRRYKARKLVRVDTGACFGRRLSAYCPELDRSVSVPTHPG